MNSFYQLFDLLSGNVVADYEQEREAWDALRQVAIEYGDAELQGLGLMHMRAGELTLIAMEDDLVRRVLAMIDAPDDQATHKANALGAAAS